MDAGVTQTSDDSKPAEPEPLQARPRAALPPRKPKLQPGDFVITLPKPPSAVPNEPGLEPESQPSEGISPEAVSARPVVDTTGEQSSATGMSAPEHAEASSSGQDAAATGSEERQGPDALLQDSSVHAVHSAEVQPSSSAAVPGEDSPVSGAAQSGLASTGDNGDRAEAAQSTLSNTPAMLEPFPEREHSQGNRYGAAAARKEQAQELALEQAILVRCSIQCMHCSTLNLAHQA